MQLFGKSMWNVRKERHIKLFTTVEKRNYLVSESNYHTLYYFFSEHLLAIEVKRT